MRSEGTPDRTLQSTETVQQGQTLKRGKHSMPPITHPGKISVTKALHQSCADTHTNRPFQATRTSSCRFPPSSWLWWQPSSRQQCSCYLSCYHYPSPWRSSLPPPQLRLPLRPSMHQRCCACSFWTSAHQAETKQTTNKNKNNIS